MSIRSRFDAARRNFGPRNVSFLRLVRSVFLINFCGAGTSLRFVRTSSYWPILHIEAPRCRSICYQTRRLRCWGKVRFWARSRGCCERKSTLARDAVCLLLAVGDHIRSGANYAFLWRWSILQDRCCATRKATDTTDANSVRCSHAKPGLCTTTTSATLGTCAAPNRGRCSAR